VGSGRLSDASAGGEGNPGGGRRSVVIEGEEYELIPYGAERINGVPTFSQPCHVCGTAPGSVHRPTCTLGRNRPYRRPEHCRDCGVPIGAVHVLTCGVELCPRCGHQYMSCPCISNEDGPPGEDEE
jgi:hypothetical protein